MRDATTSTATVARVEPLAPFARHVLEGLSQRKKALSAQWLYDSRGSALFERITELDEYYPTRSEIEILDAHAQDIAREMGRGAVVVEFGSGSSVKTEILLQALESPAAYVAIDISASILELAKNRLRQNFPGLEVRTCVGDFTRLETLPLGLPAGRRLLFFPGSTIGNFDAQAALDLLDRFRQLLGPGGRLLIGVDLEKSLSVLLPAYDDARGVTAEFNLNLLRRINRELDGDFDVELFRHQARYNAQAHRIEMLLVSQAEQTVRVMGRPFRFAKGETIHTENSHKFTPERFASLAHKAGFSVRDFSTDARGYFGLFLLSA